MVEERRVLLEGSTVLRISPPSGGLSVAREREGGMERERGCRQYGASPHLIHSVNNTGGVNYIWVAAKQWVFCRGLHRIPE